MVQLSSFKKDQQYLKFCAYGFLKNLRFYDAFLLLFFLENGFSYTQIGVIYALREITIIISEIPTGIIADTYGRKHSLVAAFAFYIVSFLVFYFSLNFELIIVAIILYGIGEAFRSGTHKGMIMDYLKLKGWDNYKIDYYGHTRSWSQKGSALSALIAGVMVLYSGNYRAIFLFSVIPYFLNFINIISYPNELNYSSIKKEDSQHRSVFSVFKDFISVIKRHEVFRIVNSAALHTSFLKSIKDYIQPVMFQIAVIVPIMVGLDIKRKSGLIIGIIYFCIYLLTSYASKMSFRLSEMHFKNVKQQTLLFGLGMGVVCGLAIYRELWVLALFVFIIIYIVENLRKPILTGVLSDNVPNELFTSVMSAQSFYSTIITSTLAVVFGVLADLYGIGIALSSISIGLIFMTIVIGNNKTKPGTSNL